MKRFGVVGFLSVMLSFGGLFHSTRSYAGSHSESSIDQGYTVLIYGDPRVYARYRLGREIRFLEEAYKRPVIALEINTMADFKATLLDLSRRKMPIQNLVFRGIHGGSYEYNPTLEVRNAFDDDFETTSFGELETLGVKLNLLPNARVNFDSCKMIESTEVKAIRSAFAHARKLGFKTGSIYLNRTDGSSAVENTFLVPFYAVDGGLKKSLGVLASQAIWYLILPVYAYRDRYELNQGYLLVETDSNEMIFKTHAAAATQFGTGPRSQSQAKALPFDGDLVFSRTK